MRLLKLAGPAAVLALAGFSLTGCGGNLDASQNCDAVLQNAAAQNVIPNVGWTLWDSTYQLLPGGGGVAYVCQGLTLAYGGFYVDFEVIDRDPVLGGNGDYYIDFGPEYGQTRLAIGGTADRCSGHDITPVLGSNCFDRDA